MSPSIARFIRRQIVPIVLGLACAASIVVIAKAQPLNAPAEERAQAYSANYRAGVIAANQGGHHKANGALCSKVAVGTARDACLGAVADVARIGIDKADVKDINVLLRDWRDGYSFVMLHDHEEVFSVGCGHGQHPMNDGCRFAVAQRGW